MANKDAGPLLLQMMQDLENNAEDTLWLTDLETVFDRLVEIYRETGGDRAKLAEAFPHYPICQEDCEDV